MRRSSWSAVVVGAVIGLVTTVHAEPAQMFLATRNAPAPISEQEARRWVSELQHAWEQRDTAELVQLGVVTPANEEHLARALSVYESLHVSFSNVSVSVDAGRTLVSYDRTDFDETGKALKYPRHTFELHRVSSDRLAAAYPHAGQN